MLGLVVMTQMNYNKGESNMDKYDFTLRVSDLYESSNVYKFITQEDLDKAIEIISSYAERYDYSDTNGGFYGQVNELLKEENIDFKYEQDYSNLETTEEIYLSI